MISSAEQAYEAIGKYLLSFIGARPWETATCRLRVYSEMASASHWLTMNGVVDESAGFEESQDAMWTGLEAAVFLRDDLLKTSGQRIWGLTFTLFPDDKFDIEYEYNMPEGYEEMDEIITGDEINASLDRLSGKDDSSS